MINTYNLIVMLLSRQLIRSSSYLMYEEKASPRNIHAMLQVNPISCTIPNAPIYTICNQSNQTPIAKSKNISFQISAISTPLQVVAPLLSNFLSASLASLSLFSLLCLFLHRLQPLLTLPQLLTKKMTVFQNPCNGKTAALTAFI